MFGTLKNFLRSRLKRKPPQPPDKEPLPLGLDRDQLAAIQALTAETHWKHYSVALERLYEQCLTALLRPSDHDQTTFYRAGCFWIEQIAKLPDDLTLKLRELDARHTAQSPELADPGAAVFASTPFWDAYQRRARQYGGAGVPLPR